MRLRNFLSYAELLHPLDFDSVHLACLSGNNGNGKSALLDAILWALWGQSRASGHRGIPQEGLINHGKSEMEVEFRFDIAGLTYLVFRRLEMRGSHRSPKTSLSLFLQGDGGFVPIGGDSVREVQKSVDEVLQIDYESFVNSAFILQGRADEFTRQTPGKRKDILSNLLGLEQFSRLQEKARQRARGFDERAALREADLKWYQAEISSKAQYESALASAVAEVSRLEKLMAGQAIEIERLDALALEERLARTERSRLLNDQRGMEASRQDARTQLDFARQRLTDLEAVTAREREIRANFEQYERLSRRRDELVSQIGELAGLQEELADGQRRVDQIRNEQVRRISNLESQRKAYRGQMSAGAEAMSRLEELIPREERLNSLRAELAEMLEQKTATAAERQASLANVRNLESSQQDLTGRIQILDREGAECPVCRQPLGDDLREDVKMQARKEWRELNDVKLDLESSIRDLKKHAERIDKTMRQTEGESKAGEELTRQVVTLQTTLQQSREAEERFKSLTGELSSLETEFRAGSGWKELEDSLRPLRAKVDRMGALRDDLARMRAGLSQVGQAPAEQEKLRAAQEGLVEAQGRVAREAQRLADFDRQAGEAACRIVEIDHLLDELRGSTRCLEEVKEARLATGRRHLQAVEARSAAQQRVNVIEARKDEMERVRQEIFGYKQEAGYFRELAECFGQRGVQAMLIEQVMPEVEGYANELLDLVTDGRMQVQFVTQRARRGSTSEEPVETLDIIVSDEGNTRPYELFSGGEAFRVNFAIRIAISKLLTRRAGTRLQFLVIDEGFGSQDAAGRQRLIEAINSIAGSFDKILVVTHVDEMKDAFPTRIEVVKEADGSQIYVS